MTDLDLHTCTPADLRRWIAERLGWRLEKRDGGVGFRPDGSAFYLHVVDQYMEHDFYEAVPNWPEDVAAATRDLAMPGMIIEYYGEQWSVEIGYASDWADDLALAICRAWSIYQMVEDKYGSEGNTDEPK